MNGTTTSTTTGRPRSRRAVLRAVIGGAALLVAGRVAGARAEPTKAPNQGPGELKSSCDKYDGVYIESKKDDVTACFWPNKGKTVCKYDGTGCYNYDPPKMTHAPGTIAGPFGGFNGDATLEVITAVEPDPAASGGAKGRRRRGTRRHR